MTNRGFASLTEAIEWAAPRWQERPVPLRLHDRDIDGVIGLRYSASFQQVLDSHPGQTVTEERTAPCAHSLRMPGMLCQTCSVRDEEGRPLAETGSAKTSTERFRYPMLRALNRLEKDRPTRPHFPTAHAFVVLLAMAGWDGRRVASLVHLDWDVTEPLLLMSLRKLHGYYAEGPVPNRVPYIERSESQLRAEGASSV